MKLTEIYQLTDEQLIDLLRLYQSEWWTKGRTLEDVRLMLQNSSLLIGLCDSGRLVAFVRVLTDYVYKAMIFDVIADENYRGQGVGKQLMDALVNHPKLQQVVSLELYCAEEMIPFYEKWGFSELTHAKDQQRFCFMRLKRP